MTIQYQNILIGLEALKSELRALIGCLRAAGVACEALYSRRLASSEPAGCAATQVNADLIRFSRRP